MTYATASAELSRPREAGSALMKQRAEERYAADLIEVLRAHRHGLRRWSVMRALRAKREADGLDIPQKFEDDVERVFRRMCANAAPVENDCRGADEALFYRPEERAGEVWAVNTERADAWLRREGAG